MAVADKAADPCGELHKDFDFISGSQDHRVLLELIARSRWSAIDSLHHLRRTVHMDRMPPATSVIANDPAFRCSERWGQVSDIGVIKDVIDLPCSIAATYPETSSTSSIGAPGASLISKRSKSASVD